jgi:glycerol uptake facilitator-like aquaporin
LKLDRFKKLDLGAYNPELGGRPALFAEGLGSFVLVLACAGAGSSFGAVGASLGGLQPVLAPGLALLTLVLLFGPASMAAFNPAVTLGLVLAGRLPKNRLLPYAAVQVAGGLAAGLVLRLLLRSTVLGISSTQMHGFAALLLEALLSAWLVWVYLAVTEKDVPLLQAALAIAATVAGAIAWAGPLSGASMNPARSLGPALAAFDFSDLWIYLIGPFLGALGAAKAYGWFRGLR